MTSQSIAGLLKTEAKSQDEANQLADRFIKEIEDIATK